MPTLIAVGLAAAALLAVVAAYTLHRDTNRETVDSTHDARPRDVGHAHAITQTHRSCDMEWCPAKSAAYWMLADAGHLTPTEQMLRRRVVA